jgi:hypothetical protein
MRDWKESCNEATKYPSAMPLQMPKNNSITRNQVAEKASKKWIIVSRWLLMSNLQGFD